MADIPGIIEGASEGKGLGLRFLRHIERNSILLFVVSADAENPLKEYKTLLKELKLYNPELLDKKRVLSISKIDLIDEKQIKKIKAKIPEDLPYMFFSALTTQGINDLKDLIWENLER